MNIYANRRSGHPRRCPFPSTAQPPSTVSDDYPIYRASRTGQYRAVGLSDDWELKIHELREDTRVPLCGPKPTSWTSGGKEYEMRLTEFLFTKDVTCEKCREIHWKSQA